MKQQLLAHAPCRSSLTASDATLEPGTEGWRTRNKAFGTGLPRLYFMNG
jgi:hypothetical protein